MKLSIVTINRNNAAGLEKTMESVFAQTRDDFEYLVIDGASTDQSVAIINKYKSKLTYWVSEKDTGVYNAMNKGLARAKGEYVLFLNSGDTFYDSSVISFFFPFLDGKDIVYGDFVIQYPDGRNEVIINNKEISYLSFLGRERHFCHQAVFMSRKSIDKTGGLFDETLKIMADWKMIAVAICKQNASLEYINHFVCNYEGSGLSMQASNSSLVLNEYKQVLKNEFSLLYKDVERLRQMGTSFAELFNSKYFRFILQSKRKIKALARKSGF